MTLRRFLSLTSLLICQGLILGIAFKYNDITKLGPGWWQQLFLNAHVAMPIGTLIGAAIFLIGGTQVRQIAMASPTAPRDRMGTFLAVQIAAYLGFLLFCIALFRPVESAIEHPAAWVIIWLAAAAAICLLWVRALIPWRTMVAIVAGAWGRLLAGAAVGMTAWTAGYLTQIQWWNLRLAALSGATLKGSAAILKIIDPIVTTSYPTPDHPFQPYIIRDGNFAAQVAYECSGYEGVGLLWVFLAAYFWMFRRRLRFPGVLLLVPVATAIIWLANMARIAALVWVGAHVSPGVAVGGFHSFAGTVLFMFISVGTVLIAERTPLFCEQDAQELPRHRNPAACYLIPFLFFIATRMITGVFTNDVLGSIDPFLPVSYLIAVAALWRYRRDYAAMEFGVSTFAILLGAAVFGVWKVMPQMHINPPEEMEDWFPYWVAARIIGYVAVTPIVEELAFRGYLARRLMSADFEAVPMRNLSWIAIVISSALFGAMHGALWPVAAIAGAAYALAARRTGRLSDAIVAHAITNALLAIIAISTQSWWLIS